MQKFFILEGGYLVLAAVVLLVTLFVSTRPFMSHDAPRKGMMWVTIFLVFFIGAHYYVTTSRMAEVKRVFESGGTVLCESRMLRKAAQSVRIRKANEWHMEGDNFVSPHYERPFFSARCIVE